MLRVGRDGDVGARLMQCPLCGQDSSVALMGVRTYVDICTSCNMHHYGGAERNKCQKCNNYGMTRERVGDREKIPDCEPCGECKEHMAMGFLLLEAEKNDKGTMLTGNRWVITHEAAERMLQDMDLERGVAYIPPEIAKQLGLHECLSSDDSSKSVDCDTGS